MRSEIIEIAEEKLSKLSICQHNGIVVESRKSTPTPIRFAYFKNSNINGFVILTLNFVNVLLYITKRLTNQALASTISVPCSLALKPSTRLRREGHFWQKISV